MDAFLPLIVKFVGDTALIIAVKFKKLKAISAILLMGADVSIKNENGITADDLTTTIFGKSIKKFSYEARVGPNSTNRICDDYLLSFLCSCFCCHSCIPDCFRSFL